MAGYATREASAGLKCLSSTPTHVVVVAASFNARRIKPLFSIRKPTMSNEDQSIRGLFAKAERAREELGTSYEPNSPTYQENLTNTIATYLQCLKKAEDFSLFSPNETLEDITSSDIQYVAYNDVCSSV